MAYRTDQWFNLEAAGENINRADEIVGYDWISADNDDFIYPNRIIRDPLRNSDIRLQRGYIRSLTTENNEKKMPTGKCQFQFNPQFLNQSINQNTSILNFLQQDPAQYAQPIPGNVSFAFELFFDRSMEMNQWKSTDPISLTNPWEESSPSNIGVLHDLSALFKVIGVGLNKEFSDYAQGVLERNIVTEINKKTLETEDEEWDPAAEQDKAVGAATTFLSYNLGNSAFLLPLPVRIVFSSLYILEGLVNSAQVTFTKFNAAMVPMQCTVNVVFEAKYIGFAKKDTFFTDILKQQEEQELLENTIDATTEEVEAYYDAISNDLQKLEVSVYQWDAYSTALVERSLDGHLKYLNRDSAVGDYGGPYFRNLSSNQDADSIFTDYPIEDARLYLHLGFPSTYPSGEGSRLVDLAINNNLSVTLAVDAEAEMWRFSEEFLSRYGKYRTLIQDNRAGPLTPSPAFATDTDSRVRDRLDDMYKDLRSWYNDTLTGNYPGVVQKLDAGDNLREFSTVQQIWRVFLDNDHVQDDTYFKFRAEAPDAASLQAMFSGGCVSSSQPGKKGATTLDGDFIADRSVGDGSTSTKEPNKYPKITAFNYLIRYNVRLTLSIDGKDLPASTRTDYVVFTSGSSPTCISNKYLYMPWPKPDTSNGNPSGAGNGTNGYSIDELNEQARLSLEAGAIT